MHPDFSPERVTLHSTRNIKYNSLHLTLASRKGCSESAGAQSLQSCRKLLVCWTFNVLAQPQASRSLGMWEQMGPVAEERKFNVTQESSFWRKDSKET